MSEAAAAIRIEDSPSIADRRIAMLLMTAFAVCWAVIEYEFGRRLRTPYDLKQIVWCRYATHLAIAFMIWGWRTPSRLWRTTRPGLQLGRSLLMLVMPLSFGFAISDGSDPGGAWAIFWCAPLLVLVFATVVGSERASPLIWLLTGLASFAAMTIVAPVSLPDGRALIWPLVMAASFALYVVLTRMLRHEALSANLFYTAVGVFIPLTLVVPRVWITPSLHDAVILFAIGALGFVALLALDRASERAEVSRTGAFITVQVAVTLLVVLGSGGDLAIALPVLAGLVLLLATLALLWVVGSRTRARA